MQNFYLENILFLHCGNNAVLRSKYLLTTSTVLSSGRNMIMGLKVNTIKQANNLKCTSTCSSGPSRQITLLLLQC